MATTSFLMTTEELLALPDDGVTRELIRGELREYPMTTRGFPHCLALANLTALTPVKFVPVIVTMAPVEPLDGLRLLTDGQLPLLMSARIPKLPARVAPNESMISKSLPSAEA